MKKTILIFMMLSLTIASFSKEKEESVKENKKIEISQSEKEDYKNNDFILCMDSYNIKNLKRIIGADSDNKVHLLLEYGKNTRDISDPWYTGNFDLTYDDIVEGCEGFLDYLANNNLI